MQRLQQQSRGLDATDANNEIAGAHLDRMPPQALCRRALDSPTGCRKAHDGGVEQAEEPLRAVDFRMIKLGQIRLRAPPGEIGLDVLSQLRLLEPGPAPYFGIRRTAGAQADTIDRAPIIRHKLRMRERPAAPFDPRSTFKIQWPQRQYLPKPPRRRSAISTKAALVNATVRHADAHRRVEGVNIGLVLAPARLQYHDVIIAGRECSSQNKAGRTSPDYANIRLDGRQRLVAVKILDHPIC